MRRNISVFRPYADFGQAISSFGYAPISRRQGGCHDLRLCSRERKQTHRHAKRGGPGKISIFFIFIFLVMLLRVFGIPSVLRCSTSTRCALNQCSQGGIPAAANDLYSPSHRGTRCPIFIFTLGQETEEFRHPTLLRNIISS